MTSGTLFACFTIWCTVSEVLNRNHSSPIHYRGPMYRISRVLKQVKHRPFTAQGNKYHSTGVTSRKLEIVAPSMKQACCARLVVVAGVQKRWAKPETGRGPLTGGCSDQHTQIRRQHQQALRGEHRRHCSGLGEIIAGLLMRAPQGLPSHLSHISITLRYLSLQQSIICIS